MRAILAIILCGVSCGPAAAGTAYCPRVTCEHNADTTDLARFRHFGPWKDKTGNDLAVAIWQYLCDYETGLYHFYEVKDGNDPFSEYATMREPLKMLNVYNCGFCGSFGPTVEGIYHGCGFTGRSFGLPGWAHCATEIHYDDAWHYFDVDVRGALVKRNGVVASLAEAQADTQLWLDSRERIKPFFPHHNTPAEAKRVAAIYAKSGVDYNYRWFQGSHTADYALRPGETFTRWWQPQDGHWNHRQEYNKEKWTRELILRPPVGMKPNHREFTRWNHGEGLFHYEPHLTAASDDLAAGGWLLKAARADRDGLVLIGGGEAIFRITTPFVIAPKVNDILNEVDDSAASVVTLDAMGQVRLAISLDNGQIWTDVATVENETRAVDLTRWVKGTYGYWARLIPAGRLISGGDADAKVKTLAVDTWVQVAPISLPRLKQGTNRLRYECGDRYGGATEPVLVLPNLGDPADLRKYAVEMPKDYDPKRNTSRVRGDLTVALAAPPGTKIAWFSVGATFTTHQGDGAKQTDNRIAWAAGAPKDFVEVYKAEVPTWVEHWRYNYDTDVRLPTPAKVVYVRFTGRPGVNVIRACLHVVPARRHDPALKITHGYRVGQEFVEKTIERQSPGDYTIDCPGEVENVFIRMEKPSRRFEDQ